MLVLITDAVVVGWGETTKILDNTLIISLATSLTNNLLALSHILFFFDGSFSDAKDYANNNSHTEDKAANNGYNHGVVNGFECVNVNRLLLSTRLLGLGSDLLAEVGDLRFQFLGLNSRCKVLCIRFLFNINKRILLLGHLRQNNRFLWHDRWFRRNINWSGRLR